MKQYSKYATGRPTHRFWNWLESEWHCLIWSALLHCVKFEFPSEEDGLQFNSKYNSYTSDIQFNHNLELRMFEEGALSPLCSIVPWALLCSCFSAEKTWKVEMIFHGVESSTFGAATFLWGKAEKWTNFIMLLRKTVSYGGRSDMILCGKQKSFSMELILLGHTNVPLGD